jgi:molecular chaperone GrpE
MKKNRTGNDSDRGRSGRAQRRSDGKRREAAESGAPAAAESPASDPDAAHSQAASNGVDCAPGGDGCPPHGAADGHFSDLKQDDEPATGADSRSGQVADLTAEIAQLRDDLLRKQADFENSRKRLIRDKEEAIRFANDALLLDLTGILDDFGRAISASEKSRDFATLHSGIELIEKQLLATLERKWGLNRFDSAGQPFDPERHEALATEPSTEYREATVLEDYQKGYVLHGRVIRAARVRVATPVEEARDTPDQQAGSDGSG